MRRRNIIIRIKNDYHVYKMALLYRKTIIHTHSDVYGSGCIMVAMVITFLGGRSFPCNKGCLYGTFQCLCIQFSRVSLLYERKDICIYSFTKYLDTPTSSPVAVCVNM